MANKDICNDEKQLIELKLVSLIHGIALRKMNRIEIFLKKIFHFIFRFFAKSGEKRIDSKSFCDFHHQTAQKSDSAKHFNVVSTGDQRRNQIERLVRTGGSLKRKKSRRTKILFFRIKSVKFYWTKRQKNKNVFQQRPTINRHLFHRHQNKMRMANS